jgi:hypothetical protein
MAMTIVETTCSVTAGVEAFEKPPEQLEAHLTKYDKPIYAALQMSPEQLASDCPTTIRSVGTLGPGATVRGGRR